LSGRILDLVWQTPGLFQKDLFRLVGEKDILVLSVLDELIRDGIIVRRDEPARIFPAGETAATIVEGPRSAEGGAAVSNPANAAKALSLIRLYQLLTLELRLDVRFDEHLTASRRGERVLQVEVYPAGLILRFDGAVNDPKKVFPGVPVIELDGLLTLGPLALSHLPVVAKGLSRLLS
jgi:hypothetical protein